MLTTRGRLVWVNQTILDQADFFQSNNFSRVAGLSVTDLTGKVFHNNVPMGWTLSNGTTVTESQVTSGHLYFHEITGAPGYYSVRFRPNNTGYWRILLSYAAGEQILAQDYDVLAEPTVSGGLRASVTSNTSCR